LRHIRNTSSIIVPELPDRYKTWAEERMSEWEELIENPPGRRLANLRTSRKFREKLRYLAWKASNQLEPSLEANAAWVKGMRVLMYFVPGMESPRFWQKARAPALTILFGEPGLWAQALS
jgi:hypothetical protein